MAVTVGGTSITFNDGTTQSTAAGAVTTTAVLNATAGASLGAVGSYSFLVRSTNGNFTYEPGVTVAGSALRYTGAVAVRATSAYPAGTWRCMAYSYNTEFCGGANVSGTLFLRIS